MATGSNVNIEMRGDETTIRIRPRFRLYRFIAIPSILALSWFWMGLISLMVMASFLESWGTEGPYWFEICMFFLFGIVGHYLAAMLFAISFAGETLTLQGRDLFYRFTRFGIGFTRRYKVKEITIENIPESIIGHNPVTRFFGLSKPRFRIRKGRKSKVICGDVNGAGASKIAETLRSRNLIS